MSMQAKVPPYKVSRIEYKVPTTLQGTSTRYEYKIRVQDTSTFRPCNFHSDRYIYPVDAIIPGRPGKSQ